MENAVDKRDDWDDHWGTLNDITERNPAQHYRHQMLVGKLRDILADDPTIERIFDFGSGQGDLIAMLSEYVPSSKFFGLELSQVGVDISKQKVPGARFAKCNLLQDEGQIDDLLGTGQLGICSEVLEHLDSPDIMLKNILRYMAPGALLVITVPGGPMNAFEKRIGHRQHFTKEKLEGLVRQAGFEVVRTYRAGFPFFNLYKLTAILRGEKLNQDVEKKTGSNGLMLLVLRIFDILFKLNVADSPYGWQNMIVARKPIFND